MSHYAGYDVEAELDAMLHNGLTDNAFSSNHQNIPEPTFTKPKRKLPDWMDSDNKPVNGGIDKKKEAIRKKFSPFEFHKTQEQIQPEKKRKLEESETKLPLSKRIRVDPAVLNEFTRFYEKNLHRVVVFDVETTGFTKNDQVIEIAAVEVVRGRITGNMFHCFIQLNDGVSVDERAQEVHGISEKVLKNCINDELDVELNSTTDAVLKRFIRFVSNADLVAHNAAFDFRMLKQDFDHCENMDLFLKKNGFKLPLKEDSFCTMSFYRKVFGNNSRYDLESVCHYFGIDSSIRDRFGHNALGDCILTAKIYSYYPELVNFKASKPVSTSAESQPSTETTTVAPLRIVDPNQDDSWFGSALSYIKKLF